jgi:hypothetical protein
MGSIHDAVVSGINEFLGIQRKQLGDCNIRLVQFDEDRGGFTFDTIVEGQVSSIKDITPSQFSPRGMTPLFDAMGRGIEELGSKLANQREEDRPDNVLVCVVTDGFENASRRFKAEKVKEMVEHQTSKYNWKFTFIGANQDAVLVGKELGISMDSCLTFAANSVATANTFKSFAGYTSAVRSCAFAAYSDADRVSATVDEDGNGINVNSTNQ